MCNDSAPSETILPYSLRLSCDNIPTLGWCGRPNLIKVPKNVRRYDAFFHEYLVSDLKIDDMYDDWQMAFPSTLREINGVKRYGNKIKIGKLNDREIDLIIDYTMKEYGDLMTGWKPISFDEVECNPTATAGYPYKSFYQSKSDLLHDDPEEIQTFWDYAHLTNWRAIWHNFPKVELLKMSKLLLNIVRTITGPPAPLYYCSAVFSQPIGKRFSTKPLLTTSAIGFNKFCGGMNDMALRLNVHPNKEEADGEKWDSSDILEQLKPVWTEIKIRTMDPQYRTDENVTRIRYYDSMAIHADVLLSNSQRVQLDGTLSGENDTTYFNTWAHQAIDWLAYDRIIGKGYQYYKENMVVFFGGDDEIRSMSDEMNELFNIHERAKAYAYYSVRMKVDEAVMSKDLEGLTFFGTMFKRMPSSPDFWVGTPSKSRRIIATLLKPPRQYKISETLGRAYALLTESYWDPELNSIIYGFIEKLTKMGIEPKFTVDGEVGPVPVPQWVLCTPTLSDIRDLWLGHQ